MVRLHRPSFSLSPSGSRRTMSAYIVWLAAQPFHSHGNARASERATPDSAAEPVSRSASAGFIAARAYPFALLIFPSCEGEGGGESINSTHRVLIKTSRGVTSPSSSFGSGRSSDSSARFVMGGGVYINDSRVVSSLCDPAAGLRH